MTLLALLGACTGPSDTETSGFLYGDREVGAPYATGAGYGFDSPQLAIFAAQHVVPELYWGISPAADQSLLLWDYVQGENIADTGSCPALGADGPELHWTTNCRSQEGYDWDGTVSVIKWQEEGHEWEHWRFDVEVSSDVEGRAFDRIALQGEYYVAGHDGDSLLSHTQANLLIEAEGYWEHAFKTEVAEAWSSLALTGTWEAHDNGENTLLIFEGAADMGTYGGFTFTTEEGMVTQEGSCVGEPRGMVSMTGNQAASLRFEGQARCDRCGEFSIEGEAQSLACDPNYF